MKFPVCLRSGTMNFNGCVDQSKAVILIAPGTGIAGVRGLIQDRIFAECKGSKSSINNNLVQFVQIQYEKNTNSRESNIFLCKSYYI